MAFCRYGAITRNCLSPSFRRAIKTRSSFPTDEAAIKLLYLALRNAGKGWKRSTREWKTALNQFAIMFGDRLQAKSPREAGYTEFLTHPEELRTALTEHLKKGWQPGGEDPALTFNFGFLLGGCAGIDMTANPIALFSRIHRVHAALVEIKAPATVLEIMKRIYAAAFDAQMAVVSERSE